MEHIVMEKIKNSEDYQAREAFKALRTNILFSGKDKKVIAITSCMPNEGKSRLSLNLAVALAEGGKKVVFVDADLRKSFILAQFNLKGRINGLSLYLSGQCEYDDVLYTTSVDNLVVSFAGQVPPNPAELLGGAAFRKLIVDLRKKFDYVIVDTPPIGSVIDGAIVAEQCDGVALVIEQGAISYRFAQNVKKQLEKTGCPIIGVILNKVDMGGRSRRYGNYYSKYYGNYYGNHYAE